MEDALAKAATVYASAHVHGFVCVRDTAFNSELKESLVPHLADCSTESAGFFKL